MIIYFNNCHGTGTVAVFDQFKLVNYWLNVFYLLIQCFDEIVIAINVSVVINTD